MFISKYNRSRHRVKPEINLTSMIDVMTVLMTVFMVTAPMLTTGMNVELPKGAKTAIENAEKAVDISIDKSGTIFLAKQKVTKDNLTKKLKAMLKQNPSLSIVISGDTKTQYGKIIEVMGSLKNAGFKKVGLKTDPIDDNKKS